MTFAAPAPISWGMKHALAFALVLALAAMPGAASFADDVAGDKSGEDSRSILPDERELRELGDLAQEMLRRFAERMQPLAERLGALIDDLDAYAAPEVLPNGDIIIRRKPDAPPRPESAPDIDPKGGIAL